MFENKWSTTNHFCHVVVLVRNNSRCIFHFSLFIVFWNTNKMRKKEIKNSATLMVLTIFDFNCMAWSIKKIYKLEIKHEHQSFYLYVVRREHGCRLKCWWRYFFGQLLWNQHQPNYIHILSKSHNSVYTGVLEMTNVMNSYFILILCSNIYSHFLYICNFLYHLFILHVSISKWAHAWYFNSCFGIILTALILVVVVVVCSLVEDCQY